MNEQPIMNEPPTPLVQFAQTLEQLPNFVIAFTFGLLAAVISDAIITCVALGAVALGFAINIWVGLAVFFLLYSLIRTINTVAQAMHLGGQMVAQSGQMVAQSLQSPVTLPSHAQMGAGPGDA